MTNITPLNERVAEELRIAAARNRRSGADLARALGEERMWASRRLSAAVQISVEDLERLADEIGVDPVDVLRVARSGAAPLAASGS